MAFSAGEITSKLVLDKSGWNTSISDVKKDQKTLGDKIKANSAQFRKMGMAMTVAGAAIVGALGMMVKKASEAQEITTRFGTVFEDVFPKASKEAKNLADNYGLSTMAARDLLGATGDLLTGLGMQGDVALSLSARTQQLAVDLASFTNFSGGAKGASEALTKAMLGERESVKSLGIVITEAMVKEHLLTQGKSKLTGQALLQAKAEATLAIAMSQSVNAIGDYERTSTSLANVTRTLKGRLDDLIVSIGEHLIPLATDLAVKIKAVVEKITSWMKAHPGLSKWIVKITLGIGALMLVLGPFLIMLPSLAKAFTILKVKMIAMKAASLLVAAANAILGTSFTVALGPISLIVAAIAGLITIGVLLYKNWDKIKGFLTNIWNGIKDTAVKVFDGIKIFIINTLLSIVEKLSKIPIIGKFANPMKKALEKMRSEMTKTEEIVSEKSLKMAEAFVGVVKESELFKKASGFLGDKLKGLGGIFIGTKEKSEELGEGIKTVSGKITGLVTDMVDEIKKATLDEFEYRKLKAQEIYEERKALLEKEGADKEAFVLLEKTRAVTLAEIEEDITEKAKEEADEREKKQKDLTTKMAEMYAEYWTKVKEKYELFKGYLATYTDIVNQHTMDEFDYKELKLDEWYEHEIQTLQDSLGKTKEYHDAKALLDDAYKLKKGKLDEDIRLKEEEEQRKAVEAAQKAWEDKYSYVLSFIDGAGTSFGGFVGGLLDKGTTLKDELQGLWDGILGSFKSMIANMVAEWATEFLKNILMSFTTIGKKAAETGTSIGTSLGGAIKEMGKTAATIGTTIGGIIVSIAKAIATAAKTLAAAAPAILKIGLVALVLYAGFKAIGALFKGGGKQTDVTYWLKQITEFTGVTTDKLQGIRGMIDYNTGVWEKTMDAQFVTRNKTELIATRIKLVWDRLGAIKNLNIKIKDNTKGILSALTGKGTVYVDVFKSAVIEKLDAGIKESLEEINKSEAVKDALANLKLSTTTAIKEMQKELMMTEIEERRKLQEAIAKLQHEAQQKRTKLLDQLKILESTDKKGADIIRQQLVALEEDTVIATETMQKELMKAESLERQKLQDAITKLQHEAQEKRKDLLKQLEAVERAERDAIAKTGGFFDNLGKSIAGDLGGLGSHLAGKLSEVAGEIGALDLSVDVHVDAPDIGGIVDAIDEWGERVGGKVPAFQHGGAIEAGPYRPTAFVFGEGPERERATIEHTDRTPTAVSPESGISGRPIMIINKIFLDGRQIGESVTKRIKLGQLVLDMQGVVRTES